MPMQSAIQAMGKASVARMPVRMVQGRRWDRLDLSSLTGQERDEKGGQGHSARNIEQIMKIRLPDDQETDGRANDDADGLRGGKKADGFRPPAERRDIGYVNIGPRGVGTRPQAMDDPPEREERDRTAQQIDEAGQTIAGRSNQDQGAAAPGIDQPTHNRTEDHGGQLGGTNHDARIGLTPSQKEDENGQRGDQHRQAERIGEVGHRRGDEIHSEKTIPGMIARSRFGGAIHATRAAVFGFGFFRCLPCPKASPTRRDVPVDWDMKIPRYLRFNGIPHGTR